MTKAKAKQTEIFHGQGASAGLVLKLKPGTRSGYYGVRPNGKKWQARVYKPDRQGWDPIDTFDTVLEAAVAAALAQQQVMSGIPLLSPTRRPRPRESASQTF